MNDNIGSAFTGRVEDIRFVSGHGQFTADIVPANALHAVFFRSPVAAGMITGLDCNAAKAVTGVVAVLTAADAAADGLIIHVLKHKHLYAQCKFETTDDFSDLQDRIYLVTGEEI